MKIIMACLLLVIASSSFASDCNDLEAQYKELASMTIDLFIVDEQMREVIYAQYGASTKKEALENGWKLAKVQCEMIGAEEMAKVLRLADESIEYLLELEAESIQDFTTNSL